jgi:hypothetical protein
VSGEQRIVYHSTSDFDWAESLLSQFTGYEGWIEVDHLPSSRLVFKGYPVVHLARICHDHITSRGTHKANSAP